MLHLISSKNINFLGKGFIATMCSLALLIAGATAFVIRGDRNYGVDFRGGDLLSLSAAKTVQVGEVREALKPIHLDNEPIQQSVQGDRNFITIRSPINTSEAVDEGNQGAYPERSNSKSNAKSASAHWSEANWRRIPFGRSASAFSGS